MPAMHVRATQRQPRSPRYNSWQAGKLLLFVSHRKFAATHIRNSFCPGWRLPFAGRVPFDRATPRSITGTAIYYRVCAIWAQRFHYTGVPVRSQIRRTDRWPSALPRRARIALQVQALRPAVRWQPAFPPANRCFAHWRIAPAFRLFQLFTIAAAPGHSTGGTWRSAPLPPGPSRPPGSWPARGIGLGVHRPGLAAHWLRSIPRRSHSGYRAILASWVPLAVRLYITGWAGTGIAWRAWKVGPAFARPGRAAAPPAAIAAGTSPGRHPFWAYGTGGHLARAPGLGVSRTGRRCRLGVGPVRPAARRSGAVTGVSGSLRAAEFAALRALRAAFARSGRCAIRRFAGIRLPRSSVTRLRYSCVRQATDRQAGRWLFAGQLTTPLFAFRRAIPFTLHNSRFRRIQAAPRFAPINIRFPPQLFDWQCCAARHSINCPTSAIPAPIAINNNVYSRFTLPSFYSALFAHRLHQASIAFDPLFDFAPVAPGPANTGHRI